VRKIRLKKQKNTIDRKLLFSTLLLTLLGLVAVADASAPIALSSFSDKFYFVKQQAIWGAIGLLLLFLFSKIHYSFWEKIAIPLFIASVILLLAVLIPGIGTEALGARRWILLAPISFSLQPSELAKLALAVYFAKAASKDKKLLSYFIPLALLTLLIMLQPDLGTSLVIIGEGLSQIFLAGINLFHFFGTTLLAVFASLVLILTSDYRKGRLLTFLEQTQDPLGKGYHIKQVLLALGAGGILGVGLGQSRQKYLFLPEAATDSIFAVIAEETGFIGAAILVFLFSFFIFRGFKIIGNAPDKFSQILSAGIVTWIGGQAILNIASMVALVPLTGIPLPFLSYGGSSLTMVLLATGILLNISRYESKTK
jgi:cell division protein FtsW